MDRDTCSTGGGRGREPGASLPAGGRSPRSPGGRCRQGWRCFCASAPAACSGSLQGRRALPTAPPRPAGSPNALARRMPGDWGRTAHGGLGTSHLVSEGVPPVTLPLSAQTDAPVPGAGWGLQESLTPPPLQAGHNPPGSGWRAWLAGVAHLQIQVPTRLRARMPSSSLGLSQDRGHQVPLVRQTLAWLSRRGRQRAPGGRPAAQVASPRETQAGALQEAGAGRGRASQTLVHPRALPSNEGDPKPTAPV